MKKKEKDLCSVCGKELTGNEFPSGYHRKCLKQGEV